MIGRNLQLDNPVTEVTFALPPWDEHHPRWKEIDDRLPENHLARQIDAGVDRLDLEPLFRSYVGRGSLPLRPDLMLKMVMYETAIGEPSPADWFHDTRNSDAVKWIGFGIQPGRSACYEFRERLQPYWDNWIAQVLHSAIDQGFTEARRTAQDGTTIAANASRHRLVNQDTLQRRRQELEAAIAGDEQGQLPERVPGWMAKHPHTRKQQQIRYQRVAERMAELQLQNQQRRACKRRPAEKLVISTSDPESICGRDKLGVFRPLYNVQLNYDLDSPLILSYEVFPQANDNGTLQTMIERTCELTGVKPEVIAADATYASVLDLQVCQQHGITLYAPVGENDYSEKNERKPQTNQFTQLPKSQFTWLPEDATYACPQGHPMQAEKTSSVKRSNDQRLLSTLYRCAPEHCRACPLQAACTPNPEKGRTVSRLEHEELLDELRARMKTDEAKALYRLRSRTVELAFADIKQHRDVRCLNGRGLRHAKAQIAATVLAHNLLTILKLENKSQANETPLKTTRTLQKVG